VSADGAGATDRRVVIIGGGFGGVEAARRLKHADVEVTIVDRHNHLLFQPLIYQVAAGALASARRRRQFGTYSRVSPTPPR
jgi:NADH dehydrogenase FAD-containing subunit